MDPVSAVIITHNEESDIKRCIQSVLTVADEIIVVDSFSTDATKALCTAYSQVKFVERVFDGYGQQKNFGISLAKNKWIVSLDADEVLSPELIKSIKNIKNSSDSDGFVCNRLTNYCGTWIRHGGWYPDRKLRLWDKTKGLWNHALIHEEVVLASGSKTSRLDGDIEHYSYDSIAQHVAQANAFTNLTAQSACERGKKSAMFSVIMRSLWKFANDFFLKQGFLDGYHGFVIALISSFATFLKYAKLRELTKKPT